ncbi:MAG: NAD-dependent succinate-semialdehyde dehydrogenase [Flavobacterium sp.]|nr:NAD-dependent succinate-semialdehyde dehydrogenase [Pedobacter sp.]
MTESINPTTGKPNKSYSSHTKIEIDDKVDQTYNAWDSWRQTSFAERSVMMRNAGRALRNRKDELANLMAIEMGKPLKGGVAEIEKCADACSFYADNAKRFLRDEPVKTDAGKSYISYQPLGVILAVMPWNFPFWQVFRFLAPCLMAGNCGILKHASNVPGCALAIEDIIKKAGFPPFVFQTLLIDSKSVNAVIENSKISAVTLTGSVEAGKKIAEKAGSVLKKTVLELGGSDAYIVLEDADLDLAAETCVNSRLINSGQSCIAAKRFIVMEKVGKKFIELFKDKMSAKVVGDPLNDKTDVGPLARLDLRDELHKQVEGSIQKGAICILGGKIEPGTHAFYPPTILTNVKKGMPAYDEELFGPVASIILAMNENEAINIANDTVFGLGAAIFSRDIVKAEEIAAKRLQAGSCFVNSLVKSDPRLPFGGIKNSGYGRELAAFGIREFVNIKTVYVK